MTTFTMATHAISAPRQPDRQVPNGLNGSDLRIVCEALNASDNEDALCLLDAILETLELTIRTIHPVTLRHPLKPTTSIKSAGRNGFHHDGHIHTLRRGRTP
jgi:hypothetical protein